jgi:hypothetical protein
MLIKAALLAPVADAFTINAVEHRPTRGTPSDADYMGPPIHVNQHRLYVTGDNPNSDTPVVISRYQYIDCFKAPIANIPAADISAIGQDPNECLEVCKQEYPLTPSYEILMAIHVGATEGRCACVKETTGILASGFQVAEDSARCDSICKYYKNPLCGGEPDYWGVFREYDFQSLSAQGAYDPWRYIWYSVVTIREQSIQGGYGIADGIQPERYYLNAVDAYTGLAQFPYQMELSKLVYGIQYDIDGSMLVGMATELKTGRIRDDIDWVYTLCRIYINVTSVLEPTMQISFSQPINIVQPQSLNYLGFSPASAILSILNVFIFTQVEGAADKRLMKDRFYFLNIEDANIIKEDAVDFKVIQLFANEQYGDVSAIGPRVREAQFLAQEGQPKGSQTYVYLARVYHSEISEDTLVDWRWNVINPILLSEEAVIGAFQLYPGIGTSEHLYNKTAIVYRFVPPDPIYSAFTIHEVNIRTKGFKNWCNEDNGNVCQGTLSYETPYAGLYNREPGIPLSLKSPSLLTARFTIEAVSIIVDFDRSTLKGAKQIDENNDYVPDYVNESLMKTQCSCSVLGMRKVQKTQSQHVVFGKVLPKSRSSCQESSISQRVTQYF